MSQSLTENQLKMNKLSKIIRIGNRSALLFKIKFWSSFNIKINSLLIKNRMPAKMIIKKLTSKKLKNWLFLNYKVRVPLI